MRTTGGHKSSFVAFFALPSQMGALYFDGTDITDFINQWGREYLTMDWTDLQKIRKVPGYIL